MYFITPPSHTHTRTEITKSVRARSKQSKSPAWRTRPLFATLAMAAFFPLIFSLPVCPQRYLCCKEVQCDVTRQPTNRGALHPPSFVFQPSGIMRAALNDLGDVPGAKDIVYCVLLRSFSISPPSNHCPSGSASPPLRGSCSHECAPFRSRKTKAAIDNRRIRSVSGRAQRGFRRRPMLACGGIALCGCSRLAGPLWLFIASPTPHPQAIRRLRPCPSCPPERRIELMAPYKW